MAISFRGLVGASATIGVLRAVSSRLGRSKQRRDDRERSDRDRRRTQYKASEKRKAQAFDDLLSAAKAIREIPPDVLKAKRNNERVQRETRRANFDRSERERISRRENRTLLAKVGSAISSVFDLFGLSTIGNLVRQNTRALTFGDVLRKVVSSKLVQAYAGAVAYNKFARYPQPPDPKVTAISIRTMELIGYRWLQVAKRLCPKDTGRLARSLQLEFYRQRSTERAHYSMAIVSSVEYFERVNLETGFISHAFQAIRRDIPAILQQELRRVGDVPVARRVQVKMPDFARVDALSNPVRVERLPRFSTGQVTNV